MINYVDKMADATVDVLKVFEPGCGMGGASDMKTMTAYSRMVLSCHRKCGVFEITAILQYTQQEAVFEDEIGELMLGIALVEMKHYAHTGTPS